MVRGVIPMRRSLILGKHSISLLVITVIPVHTTKRLVPFPVSPCCSHFTGSKCAVYLCRSNSVRNRG